MTEQKTLKQHLADNSIYLSDEILKRIEKAVKSYNKEWLTQKRQENSKSSLEIKRNVVNFFGKHWLDADELLEELSDNGITEGKK
jgi:hypothetical protein